ncbi:MAG: DUF427 domain-containing protein [Rhodoglobus sp.]
MTTPSRGSVPPSRRPQPLPARSGHESVWDYPRPPRVESRSERVVVRLGGQIIVDTTSSVRVLETSHPPVYYVPVSSFATGALIPVEGTSFCEFKGQAHYFDLLGGAVVASRAGWTYPMPTRGFEALSTRVAIYPSRVDSCELDGERVVSQAGDFYGGWVTANIVGPFKGGPGTAGW